MAQRIKIGSFDTPVFIQNATRTADGRGQVIETWSQKYRLMCSVDNLQQNAQAGAERELMLNSATLTSHYVWNITVADRAVINGVNYKINSVQRVKNTYMLITVTEIPE